MPLSCLRRVEETPDTATFILARPDRSDYAFVPGQFVSVGVPIDGRTHWRAYSISSSSTDRDILSITVRRAPGGRVSNWLHDHVGEGSVLEVSPPMGDFVLRSADVTEHVALFAAGCGITPLMPMVDSLLVNHPATNIHLFHSARDEQNLIFGDRLRQLALRYPSFRYHPFFSRPLAANEHQSGRLNAASVRERLPRTEALTVFLCGQPAYMNDVAGWLEDEGLSADRIHRESFAVPLGDTNAAEERYSLSIPDFDRQTEIQAGQSLLEVIKRAGLPIDAACRAGVCGACVCRVVEGTTHSDTPSPFPPEAVAAGYVTACTTKATSDLVIAFN